MSTADLVGVIGGDPPEVSVQSYFELSTIWAGLGWLLMDRILQQVRYLLWDEGAWRSDCDEETATGSGRILPVPREGYKDFPPLLCDSRNRSPTSRSRD